MTRRERTVSTAARKVGAKLSPSPPGSITADLRQAGVYWWRIERQESMEIWRAARVSLGLPALITPYEGWQYNPDISSEAIEHAEALGL